MKKQSKKTLFGSCNPFGRQRQHEVQEGSQRGDILSPIVRDEEQATTNIERQTSKIAPPRSGKPVASCPTRLSDTAVVPQQHRHYQSPDLRNEELHNLLGSLDNKNVTEVVLYGEHGVGKTWIAKELTVRVILNRMVDITIWVYLNRKYENHVALYKSIARQLSLQLDIAGAECYLDDYDDLTERELAQFLRQRLEGKTYLLVLDDENSEMKKEGVISMLEGILDDEKKEESKILITRVEKGMDDNSPSDIDQCSEAKQLEIKPLSLSESVFLLRERIQINIDYHLLGDVELAEIAKKSKCLPAAIVFVATALRFILKDESVELLNKKLAVQEAAAKLLDEYWTLSQSSSYAKFSNSLMIRRCFWRTKVYFEQLESIHYNELISYWILEGCLGDIITRENSYSSAYAKGHEILMDLLDAGLLGQREAGDVVLETAGLHFATYHYAGLCSEIQVGFPFIFKESNGLGNVKPMADKIVAFKKSTLEGYEEVSLSALMLHGDHLMSKEDQDRILDQSLITRLQLLSIFHHHLDISSFPSMPKLSVLILRDCPSLSSIDAIKNLKTLIALEISGFTCLEDIPDDFLDNFPNLESLNLSGLPLQYFPRPSSTTALTKLRSLILRRCTRLEIFPEVKGLGELEVLDLSGATSLAILNKKHEKFEGVPKLKMLDLSETNICEFPGLDELQNLTYLMLKKCPLLNKLKSLAKLTKLEVIDASGSSKLPRIIEPNLPARSNCLRKVDLSGTMIPMLPPLKDATNLIYLYLNNCPNLKELPVIEGARKLRVIDLSDSKVLESIKASFEEMSSLQELYLSQTKIKTLPPLSGLGNLRKLILSGCESLTSLPEMGMQTSLQVFVLSGCKALATLPDEPFTDMHSLEMLDLSRTCFSRDNLSETILQCIGPKITFTDPQESINQTSFEQS